MTIRRTNSTEISSLEPTPLFFFTIGKSSSLLEFYRSISRNNLTNPKTKRFVEITDRAITGPCNYLYNGQEGSGYISHYWTFRNAISYHLAPTRGQELPVKVRTFVRNFLNELAGSESHFCPEVKEVPH